MPVVRRALAALPVVAVAMAAAPAQGAEVQTRPCVLYIEEGPLAARTVAATMPVLASGFTPGAFATISTNSVASPTLRTLATGNFTPAGTPAPGAFAAMTAPPPFTKSNGNIETFNLIAEDRTKPAAPIIAVAPFQLVRFGMTFSPTPKRPRQKVTYTARGFTPGKRVYAHFRFGGKTRRTVSLGIAKGPCGITSLKMRVLPTKVRFGKWKAYIDQSKTFKADTKPRHIEPFEITREFF